MDLSKMPVGKRQHEDECPRDIKPIAQDCPVKLTPSKSKRKRAGQYDHEIEQKRLRKWQITIRLIDWKCCPKKKSPQVIKRNIRDEIPDWLRGVVWQLISGGRELLAANPGIYELLLSIETSESSEKLIVKDIHRTFPSQELFKTIDGPGQRSLHNMLKAYSVYDRDVGYTQGMNFIAGMILLHMNEEEEAFWVMVSLLKGAVNMPMRGLYLEGLPLLHRFLLEFETLVNEQLPELGRHFQEQMITPSMYASGWFMTVFSADVPLPLAVRIWDILFNEGVQKTVFQVGLELLRYFEDDLLKLPFEGLIQFLRRLPEESLDPDIILLPMVKVKL